MQVLVQLSYASWRKLRLTVERLSNLVGILFETNIQLICYILTLGIVSV